MKKDRNNQQQIDLCNQALKSVQMLISIEQYQDISDYINRFGEWGIGMKVLTDQICELDKKISLEQFEKLRLAMISMGWDKCELIQDLQDYIE